MLRRLEDYDGLNVTLNITEDCNLRCRYCYEVDKQPRDLPLEYARRFFEVLLADPDPIGARDDAEFAWILDRGLIIDLIGGDALMRPQLCDDILSSFMWQAGAAKHRWAYRWRCSISSNGTLFDEPGVKPFLERYRDNISLGISVDGCPEVHDLNRSGSMAAILKNWDWYLAYAGRAASTKSTLNRDSIPYLFKSLKFLHETLGLQQINQNFIFEPMGETEDDLLLLDRQMEQCVDYVLQHRHDLYWGMIDNLFATSACMADPNKGWCGSGAMPCLSVNGHIYPCFRFMPHTMHSRDFDFHVGDVWNGFDHKERFVEVRRQTRKVISEPKCLECPVESSCAWCIGGAFSECGRFYRQTNICNVHKIQAKWSKVYFEQYARLEPEAAARLYDGQPIR